VTTYYVELDKILSAPGQPDYDRIIALAGRYGLEFDFSRLEELSQKYQVSLG
jgi:hypothetical protein